MKKPINAVICKLYVCTTVLVTIICVPCDTTKSVFFNSEKIIGGKECKIGNGFVIGSTESYLMLCSSEIEVLMHRK
jgi:hypothetical protein